MMNNSSKSTFDELRSYESRRRLAYTSKLDATSLYWKSYLDLIKAALSETGRAQRLVLGTCRAHQTYAIAMESMYEDTFLDEKGNIATEKQQKRLALARKKASTLKEKDSQQLGFFEIREAQQQLANKFGENAKNMDEEIADAITSLYNDSKTQFSSLEELGTTVLDELEKTEMEVSRAWDTYLSKADKKSSKSSMSTSEDEKQGRMNDTWLNEAQYRVAVQYQNTAWANANHKMEELFREVKQQEIRRRMNLREFLVAFVQRQQRMFLELPGIHSSILEELVGTEISKEDIERNIQMEIQSSSNGVPSDNDNEMILDSPLKSDLLAKAKVVERRTIQSSGSPGEWIVSFAVMTADSYVHFFDLQDSSITPTSSSESVIQVLMPDVIVPTVDNLSLGRSNFSRGWNESLTPTDSMVLAKCMLQNDDETIIRIMERGGTTGSAASKMFLKLTNKKIEVRTQSLAEKEEFIDALMTHFQ